MHKLHDRVSDGLFELEPALLTQGRRQEAHQHTVLLRVFEAELPDGGDYDHLELVGDLVHEAVDLLHEPVHAGLRPRLEQRGDGEGGDRAVGVGDEGLHVVVTLDDGHRVAHRDLAEAAHGRVAEGRLRRREEELEHRNGRVEIALVEIVEGADGLRCLVDHDLAAMAQGGLQERLRHAGDRGGGIIVENLRNVADEQTHAERGAHVRLGELGDHLGDGQPVVLLDLVQERERVELDHIVRRANRLLDLVHPAAHHLG
mmetsp:Transcript_70958/g.199011  ORF Transcript_70958/g.199011 Transcript_70958/m.199011 type:complete len:258 (-) Transcript_70958:632-1405(-)